MNVMSFMDLSIDQSIIVKSKSFLDEICKRVIKRNEIIQKQIVFQGITDRLFYKNFIDSLQVKFLIFKMNEYKMKQVEEQNYLKFKENERKLYLAAKGATKDFLDKSIKNTVISYKKYTSRILPLVIRVQAAFKGYITRLVSKMELMNLKLTQENEKSIERVRAKTLLARK
jgi:hypothetical protein